MKKYLIISILLVLEVSVQAQDSISININRTILDGKERITLSITNRNVYPVYIMNMGDYDNFGQLIGQSPASYWTMIGFRNYNSTTDFDKYGETKYNLFYDAKSIGKLKSIVIKGNSTFVYGPIKFFSGSENPYRVFPESAKQYIKYIQVCVTLTYFEIGETNKSFQKKSFLSNIISR